MDVLKRILCALGFELAGDRTLKPGTVAALRKFAGSGKRPWWLDYGLPLITTTVAVLVIEAAGPEAALNAPVIVFMFPIILSAYVGGLKPGLFATVIATLAADYYVLPPTHSWGVESAVNIVKLIALCGAGTLVSFLMAHREQPGQTKAAREVKGLLLFAEHRVHAGFATLLACLIAIAAVSYPALERLRSEAAWVDHTHQVISTLRLLMASLTDADTGARGYIITDKEEFLEPYHSARLRAGRALTEVRSLTRDNPEQQRRLDWMEPLVAERLANLSESIALRNTAFSPARAFISSGMGTQLDERIRAAITEMDATEQGVLAEREKLEKRASRLAKALVLGGSALAVLMAVAALWTIGKAFEASREAESALQESRDQLEVRVGERTSDLRSSEQRLRRFYESGLIGVIYWNMNGEITDANDKFLEMVGYERDDLKAGRINWATITPAEYRRLDEQSMEQLKASGVNGKPFEKEYVRKDGVRFPIIVAGAMLDEARFNGVAFVLDITERKRAEEALTQRAQELARSNADLAQFAYVASHDLKEPLRAVSGGVRLLEKGYQGKLDDFAHECIAHAIDGCLRMESLIDGLLAYSRVGTQGGELQAVECATALGTALQNLAAAIEESGAVVTHDTLPAVNGDLTQLASLFQNLIGNALKFRRESPPRIHVGAERSGTHWRFSVRDNGIGIDPQFFGRIFRVFQRLHTRREYPGTGIGLALCKKIVERHGGRIWVESLPGEETTFYFSLLAAQTSGQLEREIHAQRCDAA